MMMPARRRLQNSSAAVLHHIPALQYSGVLIMAGGALAGGDSLGKHASPETLHQATTCAQSI